MEGKRTQPLGNAEHDDSRQPNKKVFGHNRSFPFQSVPAHDRPACNSTSSSLKETRLAQRLCPATNRTVRKSTNKKARIWYN